ncbi:hypothetical protein FJT64_025116 [Amphibalanus amphitrite]|uniref:Uncharacterized protein n=1 Tax=Amphibalanus amphitrite TaxID=1232801 RepID=A0A6A4W647_AMPAM|nr:hypothetical protein FJT64_025116 [Amphibalanus amphitrite]
MRIPIRTRGPLGPGPASMHKMLDIRSLKARCRRREPRCGRCGGPHNPEQCGGPVQCLGCGGPTRCGTASAPSRKTPGGGTARSRGVEEQTEEDTEAIEELPAPPSPMAGEYGGWAEYDGPPLTSPGDCLPPPATEGDDSDEWAPPQSSDEGSSDRSSVRSLPDPFADESYMDAEDDKAEEEVAQPPPAQPARRRFQEAYDAATQVEEPAAKDRRPAPNGVAILERFAAYLRACWAAVDLNRSCSGQRRLRADATLDGRAYKLIRSWRFKTSRQHRHEAPCTLALWRRLRYTGTTSGPLRRQLQCRSQFRGQRTRK